jgi:hypothetical protein
MNVASDLRGGFAGALGMITHLYPDAVQNGFAGQTGSDDFTQIALNREPTHYQKQTVANLQINHDLTDNLLLTAKVSYETRDFHQSGDQDQSYATEPFLGAGAGLNLPPISGYLCFGSEDQSFCETVDSERLYDFSDVNMHGTQMEVNVISDFDGDFNYTAGIYQIENRNDNVYSVQSAGTQFGASFANHTYSGVIQGLTGLDWSGKAGLAFYQTVLLGWLPQVPNALSCLAGGPCDPAALQTYLAVSDSISALPEYVVPWNLAGIINDQNVDDISRAV